MQSKKKSQEDLKKSPQKKNKELAYYVNKKAFDFSPFLILSPHLLDLQLLVFLALTCYGFYLGIELDLSST